MADLKSLLQITNEAIIRDTPFINQIKTDLISAIDNCMLLETEYYVEYDINAAVSAAAGQLQKDRIKNYIIDMLKNKGYTADMRTISSTEKLVVTWVIANLSIS